MQAHTSRRVLIVFATWHGQTELIARKLALFATRRGYDVTVEAVESARARDDLSPFDRIVVCSGIQMRRHHRQAEAFVTDNLERLSSCPSTLVSISLAAGSPEGSPDRAGIQRVVDELVEKTQWVPTHVIFAAGALHYTRYNFITRWMMRRISAAHGGPIDTSRDHELTDWGQLERDAGAVFPELSAGRAAVL